MMNSSSAADQLAQEFGAPLHPRLEKRLCRGRRWVGRDYEGRLQRRHLLNARRDFAEDVSFQHGLEEVGSPDKRATTWAMCSAVLSLTEPRETVWFPSASSPSGRCSFSCEGQPFVPWDNTFWPILRAWLRNAYADEYVETARRREPSDGRARRTHGWHSWRCARHNRRIRGRGSA